MFRNSAKMFHKFRETKFREAIFAKFRFAELVISRNLSKIISQNKYLKKFREISFAKLIIRRNNAKYKKFRDIRQNHFTKSKYYLVQFRSLRIHKKPFRDHPAPGVADTDQVSLLKFCPYRFIYCGSSLFIIV